MIRCDQGPVSDVGLAKNEMTDSMVDQEPIRDEIGEAFGKHGEGGGSIGAFAERTNGPAEASRTDPPPKSKTTVLGDEVRDVLSLNDYLVPGEALLIVASCAMSKSRRSLAWLQTKIERNPNFRVIMLSVRTTHSIDLATMLADLGFVSHKMLKDTAKKLSDYPRVVCSPESLHLLGNYDTPDAFFWDECRTGCGNLVSTVAGPTANVTYALLEKFYNAATYKLFMDADAIVPGSNDDSVPLLMRSLGPTVPVHRMIYEHRKLKRSVSVFFNDKDSTTDFERRMCHSALNYKAKGLRIAVVCATCKQVNRYKAMLEGIGVKCVGYTGKSNPSQKRNDFANVDLVWVKYEAVLYNSTLTVAVNPNTTVFGEVFVASSLNGASVRDLFQALLRIGRFLNSLMNLNIKWLLAASPRDLPKAVAEDSDVAAVGLKKRVRQATRDQDDVEDYVRKLHRNGGYRSPEYISELRYYQEAENPNDAGNHVRMLMRFATHNQFPVKTYDGRRISSMPNGSVQIAVDSDSKVAFGNELSRYKFVRDHITTAGLEKAFFEDCCSQLMADDDTALDIALKSVYYNLYAYGEWLDDEQYARLLKYKSVIRLRAEAQCFTLRDARHLDQAALEYDDSGRRACDPFTQSHKLRGPILRAVRELSELLGFDVLSDNPNNLTEKWVQRFQRELKCKPHKEDSEEIKAQKGKERYALFNEDFGDDGMEFAALKQLARGLTTQETGGDAFKGGSSLALVKFCLRKVGLELTMAVKEKGLTFTDPKTTKVRRVGLPVGGSVAPVPEVQELVDNRFLRCPQCEGGVHVRVSAYAAHQEEDAAFATEERYETLFLKSVAPSLDLEGGSVPYTQIFPTDMIELLAACDPRSVPQLRTLAKDKKWAKAFAQVTRLEEQRRASAEGGEIHRGEMGNVVRYYRGTGGGGRAWAQPGLICLQRMTKILRALLCTGRYFDLDMVNCHVIIVLCIVDSSAPGTNVDTLRAYVEHRKTFLVDVMAHYRCTREHAKVLFLTLLNLGNARGWQLKELGRDKETCVEDLETITDFEREMKVCQGIVLNYDEGAMAQAKARPDSDKLKAAKMLPPGWKRDKAVKDQLRKTAFSLALHTVEHKAVTAMETYLRAGEDWSVDGLIFDGLMPRIDSEHTELRLTTVSGCTKAIHDALGPGFERMQVESKPVEVCPLGAAWLEAATQARVAALGPSNMRTTQEWSLPNGDAVAESVVRDPAKAASTTSMAQELVDEECRRHGLPRFSLRAPDPNGSKGPPRLLAPTSPFVGSFRLQPDGVAAGLDDTHRILATPFYSDVDDCRTLAWNIRVLHSAPKAL